MLIAHKDQDKVQLLDDHLIQVGDYCRQVGANYGLKNMMTLVGLLHDLGKASSNFQEYIKGSKYRRVNHSSAGGKYLTVLNESVVRQDFHGYYLGIMQYVIFAHHGLFDVVHNTEDIMARRYNYDKSGEYDFEGEIIPYAEKFSFKYKVSLERLFEKGVDEFYKVFEQMANLIPRSNSGKNERDHLDYYTHCLVRLCLSILKEGDVHDSATWFLESSPDHQAQEERQALWATYTQGVEEKVQAFETIKDEHPLNHWRSEFSDQLLKQSKTHKKGIYQLSLPTGAGKTVAGLRYAVHNARYHQKQHVYYVTSFLSVLEQNAQVIKDFLEDDYPNVYEHHSNITPGVEDGRDENIENRELLLNAWDAPVTITTMVQFFNSMFKGRSDNLRRFHQLGHSVIILDEVQTLPVRVLAHFNLMMNFMSEIMGSTIILCTATQPMLDHQAMDYPIIYTDADKDKGRKEMICLSSEAQEVFKRVQAINLIDRDVYPRGLSTDNLAELILEDLEDHQSVLAIVNTKKAAEKLWEKLSEMDKVKVYYLTTNLCAAHRQDLFVEIDTYLERLQSGKESVPIVVVSTQLIEAGVDLDFEVVYRSLAGVDSLIQAAGRCNREGCYDRGFIKIFESADENLQSLPEIRGAQEATRRALGKAEVERLGQRFSLDELIKPYYQKYYVQNVENMVYKVNDARVDDDDGLLGLLSTNMLHKRELPHEGKGRLLAQSFKMASDYFNLIESNTISVVVPYKNDELIDGLRTAIDNYDYDQLPKLLAELQSYTVQVYDKRDVREYAESYLNESIWILLPEYYDTDNNRGFVVDKLATFIL